MSSLKMDGWKRFKKNKIAYLSLLFLGLIAALAIFAPLVTQYSYEHQTMGHELLKPSWTHWMGTDNLGRDLFSRVIYGARMSLAVGVLTAVFALVLGTLTGALAGYRGGWWDSVLMRIVDIFYGFPSILLAILLGILFGRGFTGIFLALGLTAWVTQARLIRGQILQAKEFPYVEAARAMGVSHAQIILKHIIPNLWGPIIVSLTFQIPTNIMTESFLSFIGLGLQPPYSSWGTLANNGRQALMSFPHLIVFPGTVLFLTMLAFNYLGDGLRDLLQPDSERILN